MKDMIKEAKRVNDVKAVAQLLKDAKKAVQQEKEQKEKEEADRVQQEKEQREKEESDRVEKEQREKEEADKDMEKKAKLEDLYKKFDEQLNIKAKEDEDETDDEDYEIKWDAQLDFDLEDEEGFVGFSDNIIPKSKKLRRSDSFTLPVKSNKKLTRSNSWTTSSGVKSTSDNQ